MADIRHKGVVIGNTETGETLAVQLQREALDEIDHFYDMNLEQFRIELGEEATEAEVARAAALLMALGRNTAYGVASRMWQRVQSQ